MRGLTITQEEEDVWNERRGPCKRLYTSSTCEWTRLQRAAKQTGKTMSLRFSKGGPVMSSGIGPDISTFWFDMLLNNVCVSIRAVGAKAADRSGRITLGELRENKGEEQRG
ncbi:hypothetical protein EYF80_010271 [Liparis tanakae]|uniref:Uncharacterized protein n=1 Tax=Liparis tanakae TaxID=230148 RepID=A0A4Z2INT9_9TELE|nr:hypothetical protein EYF80_010271 [Liparis tanakae]